MNTIETILSPALFSGRTTAAGHTTVAIDILRATSSICAAFAAGADEVVPLESLDELEIYREKGYTLAAERGGKKIGDAQCGNSPTEYRTMNLAGKRLAYSTTNGTVAILRAAEAGHTLIGCFSNLSALFERLQGEGRDVVLLCSGWIGSASMEDSLFCGALSEKLMSSGLFEPCDDATVMAIRLWRLAAGNPYDFCSVATHVHRLQSMGYDRDVRFSLQADTCRVVPQVVKSDNCYSIRI